MSTFTHAADASHAPLISLLPHASTPKLAAHSQSDLLPPLALASAVFPGAPNVSAAPTAPVTTPPAPPAAPPRVSAPGGPRSHHLMSPPPPSYDATILQLHYPSVAVPPSSSSVFIKQHDQQQQQQQQESQPPHQPSGFNASTSATGLRMSLASSSAEMPAPLLAVGLRGAPQTAAGAATSAAMSAPRAVGGSPSSTTATSAAAPSSSSSSSTTSAASVSNSTTHNGSAVVEAPATLVAAVGFAAGAAPVFAPSTPLPQPTTATVPKPTASLKPPPYQVLDFARTPGMVFVQSGAVLESTQRESERLAVNAPRPKMTAEQTCTDHTLLLSHNHQRLFVSQLPFGLSLLSVQTLLVAILQVATTTGVGCHPQQQQQDKLPGDGSVSVAFDESHFYRWEPSSKPNVGYTGCAFLRASHKAAGALLGLSKRFMFDCGGVWVATTPGAAAAMADFCEMMKQRPARSRSRDYPWPTPFAAVSIEAQRTGGSAGAPTTAAATPIAISSGPASAVGGHSTAAAGPLPLPAIFSSSLTVAPPLFASTSTTPPTATEATPAASGAHSHSLLQHQQQAQAVTNCSVSVGAATNPTNSSLSAYAFPSAASSSHLRYQPGPHAGSSSSPSSSLAASAAPATLTQMQLVPLPQPQPTQPAHTAQQQQQHQQQLALVQQQLQQLQLLQLQIMQQQQQQQAAAAAAGGIAAGAPSSSSSVAVGNMNAPFQPLQLALFAPAVVSRSGANGGSPPALALSLPASIPTHAPAQLYHRIHGVQQQQQAVGQQVLFAPPHAGFMLQPGMFAYQLPQ